MKFCTLVEVLAISCLLPIVAMKQDNVIDTAGSTKTFAKDYDAAGLPLKKATTYNLDPKYTKVGGNCMLSKGKSGGVGLDVQITNLESTMKEEIRELKQLVKYLAASNQEIKHSLCQIKDCINCTHVNASYVCPPPFTKVGEECFYWSDISDSKNWDDARSYCIGLGGDLATPHNVSLLRAYLDKIGMPFAVWIGANDRHTHGHWSYLNGQQIKPSDWSINQPSNLYSEHCLEIRQGITPPLNDYKCEVAQRFVCQYGASGCCAVQDRQMYCALKSYQMAYADSCYFISSSKESWSDAQKKCVKMGGNLVKIDDNAEFSFLQAQVTHNTWIGLSDIKNEGQFTWLADGSNLITQTWWHIGEPTDGKAHGKNKTEDCVNYRVHNGQTMLNDADCTKSHLYICEMPILCI